MRRPQPLSQARSAPPPPPPAPTFVAFPFLTSKIPFQADQKKKAKKKQETETRIKREALKRKTYRKKNPVQIMHRRLSVSGGPSSVWRVIAHSDKLLFAWLGGTDIQFSCVQRALLA